MKFILFNDTCQLGVASRSDSPSAYAKASAAEYRLQNARTKRIFFGKHAISKLMLILYSDNCQ